LEKLLAMGISSILVFFVRLRVHQVTLMNFVVDDDHLMLLIEEAQALGKHRSREEAVETALKEYVQERQQQQNK
jgi:Mg2+/Co2+ transporter CorB